MHHRVRQVLLLPGLQKDGLLGWALGLVPAAVQQVEFDQIEQVSRFLVESIQRGGGEKILFVFFGLHHLGEVIQTAKL